MQIGIRLHDMKQGTLEERLPLAHKQGFSCAQLALSKTVREYSVENAALTPGLAMYLKKLFAKNEIDIAVLGCYKNLAHPDAVELAAIQDTYYAHIRLASLLGCSVVGTETGAPNAVYKYEPACHTEEALQFFIRNLRSVVACAEKFGVIFAIEPVWNHIVYNSKCAIQVLQAINSPNLRIILDPVNLLSMENYEQRDVVIREAIRDLGDYTAVMHLKDFCIEEGKLVSVAAGTGLMDYQPILRFMKEKKPFVQATLEDTEPGNAEAARRFLEESYEKA
jgi:sugar phosphate isomerase/epimerase